MRSRLLILAAALAAPAHVPAQVPPDAWIAAVSQDYLFSTGPGGLFLLTADLQNLSLLNNQTANSVWANCVQVDPDDGAIYYGTSGGTRPPVPSAIFRIEYDPATNGLKNETQVTGPVGGYVSALALLRDDVWYIATGAGTDRAEVGYAPKIGGAHTVFFTIAQGQHSGLGNAMCANGHELYIGMSMNASSADPHNVFALDLATKQLRGLALLPTQEYPGQMDLDKDGQIVMAGNRGYMYSVDPVSGTLTTLNGRAPQNSGNGLGVHPYDHYGLVVPGLSSGGQREIHRYDIVPQAFTGTAVGIIPGGIPCDISCRVERPIEFFGSGCPGVNGKPPTTAFSGFPMLGNKLDFGLVDADGGTGSWLVFGFSDKLWGPNPLPFDMGQIGAPGCALYTDLSFTGFHLTTGAGTANQALTLPNDPALSGGQVFYQWLVSAPVNGLSLVTSDAARVRFR